jgi:hypothetical protein
VEAAAKLHGPLAARHDADQEIVRRHNPHRWAEDLETAADAADLERCGVFDGLCRDLHLLRSLDMTPPPPPPPEDEEQVLATVVLPDGTQLTTTARRSVDAKSRQVFRLQRIEGDLDVTFAAPEREVATRVEIPAGPSHLAPSPSVSARRLAGLEAGDFGAGAGTVYVANFKLLPWFRSYRPPKAAA